MRKPYPAPSNGVSTRSPSIEESKELSSNISNSQKKSQFKMMKLNLNPMVKSYTFDNKFYKNLINT